MKFLYCKKNNWFYCDNGNKFCELGPELGHCNAINNYFNFEFVLTFSTGAAVPLILQALSRRPYDFCRSE